MEKKINFDEWFDDGEKIKAGVELEVMLFDTTRKEPLQSEATADDILSGLPYNIYRDFYAYQLELRSAPSSKPENIIKEIRNLYKIASREFIKENIFLIPVPNISVDGYIPCGMHVHISYPERKTVPPYFNKAMGAYPFILAMADHSKNFELDPINTSERMNTSRHIGMPHLNKEAFIDGHGPGERKFRDMILSPPIHHKEDRHRLVKPVTIEFRLFDTPSLFSYFKLILEYTMAIAKHIKVNNPMMEYLKSPRYRDYLALTRTQLLRSRYGVNKIFRMWNTDICEDVCEHYNIDFSRETQFEYRERLGKAATTSGYLSMALEGGWL